MKNRRFKVSVWALATVITLSSFTSGCGQQKASTNSTSSQSTNEAQNSKGTHSVTNLDGSTITVPNKIDKIAVTFGPAYEKVVLLGDEDKIVADGDFHINGWPWSNKIYKRLNEVHGISNVHTKLNVEELIKYKPDVVFHFSKPDEIGKINDAGMVGVPSVSTGKLEDTKKMLTFYAEILGKNEEKIAEEYSKYFDEKLKMVTDITSKVPDDKKPTVYFCSQKLLLTSGKNSDIPEVVNLAGGKCVNKDVQGFGQVQVGIEQLIQWKPQYIFIDHAGSSGNEAAEDVIKKMITDDRYKQVSAIANNKVYICPTGVFFWDSGVQKILMVMWMAKQLHPEEFKDLDMTKELKQFYSKFFRYQLTDEESKKILDHLNP